MHQLKISTVYRQELKGRIVEAAHVLFYEHGIKSVKMDDIAQYLSISKRTLYEIYANKEDLLIEVVKQHDTEIRKHIESCSQNPEFDVMDILLEAFKLQTRQLASIHPSFFNDLQKYPKLVSYFEKRHEESKERSYQFMLKGVSEGYFLKSVNYELALHVADDLKKVIFETTAYKNYTIREIFRNLVRMLLRGVCTEKGIKRLDESGVFGDN